MSTRAQAPDVPAATVRLALIALALGGFGIGTTEFVIMGMLPDVASGMHVDIPTAGSLISGYALGVVLGAPLLTMLTVRMSRQRVLIGLMGLFTLGNLASALAPTFSLLLPARFVTGLPHGTFFGVGAVVAASLVPPRRRGRAVSMMFLGLTLANVIGVPAGTLIGQQLGWRWTFGMVAALGAVATLAVSLLIPAHAGRAATGSLRAEVGALVRPRVLLSLAVIVTGFGGLFACYSYITPMMTGVGGFSAEAITVLLVVIGLGMTVGSYAGGRLADRNPLRTLTAGILGVVAVLCALTIAAPVPWLAVPLLFALGMFSLSLGPAVQTRLLDQARDAPSLVSAALQSAANLANSLGAWLGGLTIAAGYGYTSPNLAGAALAATGLVLLRISVLYEKHPRQRTQTGEPATAGNRAEHIPGSRTSP